MDRPGLESVPEGRPQLALDELEAARWDRSEPRSDLHGAGDHLLGFGELIDHAAFDRRRPRYRLGQVDDAAQRVAARREADDLERVDGEGDPDQKLGQADPPRTAGHDAMVGRLDQDAATGDGVPVD